MKYLCYIISFLAASWQVYIEIKSHLKIRKGSRVRNKSKLWHSRIAVFFAISGSIVFLISFPENNNKTDENAIDELRDSISVLSIKMTEFQCSLDSLKAANSRLVSTPEDTTLSREIAECAQDCAITIFDSAMVAIGLGDYDLADYLLKRVRAQLIDDSIKIAEIFYYRFIANYLSGNKEMALLNIDSALVFKNEYLLIGNDRGVVLSDLGRYEEAISSYDSVLAYLNCYPITWYNRGNALSYLGRYEEAISSYDSTLKYLHNFSAAWYNRGVAQSNLGEMEDAISSYDSALMYDNNKPWIWYNRGNALDFLKRYDEAISSYDSALIYKHNYQNAWYNRGISLVNLRQYEKAIASYDSALLYNQDNVEAWNGRGIALRNLGCWDEAVASYDSALHYKHDYYEAWNNRAVALASGGRFKNAIESVDSALYYKPDDSLFLELRELLNSKLDLH